MRIECIVIDFSDTLSNTRYFCEAPPECPEWAELVEEQVFRRPGVFDAWMDGSFTADDAAAQLAPLAGMSVAAASAHLRQGCRGLQLNPGVLRFVEDQRARGRRTALVTLNIDLFTEVVVPDLALDRFFDVIVNSADHGDARKQNLWSLALEATGCEYAGAFALDDSAANVGRFIVRGGQAHRYSDDAELAAWLRSSDPTARRLQEDHR